MMCSKMVSCYGNDKSNATFKEAITTWVGLLLVTFLMLFGLVPYAASPTTPEEEDNQDVVSLATWLKKPDVIDSFKCHEVKVNGHMFESNLLVTSSHIYVLRDIPGRKGFAQIKVRRPLSAIVKITSKKKHPEVITFKYGVPEGDSLVVSDLDKFLIPNASEATKLISQQILKQLKSSEG